VQLSATTCPHMQRNTSSLRQPRRRRSSLIATPVVWRKKGHSRTPVRITPGQLIRTGVFWFSWELVRKGLEGYGIMRPRRRRSSLRPEGYLSAAQMQAATSALRAQLGGMPVASDVKPVRSTATSIIS